MVLVCPHDHASLDYNESESTLACSKCHRIFPIVDGVPNMLK